MNHLIRSFLALGMLSIMSATVAQAQDQGMSDAAAVPPAAPVNNFLHGHRFTPSTLVLNPFATSQATIGFLLGVVKPEVLIGDREKKLELAAVAPTVEAQFTVVPKVTLLLGMTGAVVAGINPESALIYGASTGYRPRVEGQWQFLTGENFVLSTALRIAKTHTYAVSPLVSARRALGNLLRGGSSETDPADDRTEWYPSVRYAFAISPLLGIQGDLGPVFRSGGSDDGLPIAQDDSRFRFSLVFDFQLKPSIGVPLAVNVGYLRNQVLTNGGAANADNYGIGLFETVSSGFNFGAQYMLTHTESRDAHSVTVLGRFYY